MWIKEKVVRLPRQNVLRFPSCPSCPLWFLQLMSNHEESLRISESKVPVEKLTQ